jgi:hypothetical protein
MNAYNENLRDLCSRKLLDLYQKTSAGPVKSAIEEVLNERQHFTQQVQRVSMTH